jgi:hypothetical protein
MVEEINAKEFVNFLIEQETSGLLGFAKDNSFWGPIGDGYWDGRVVHAAIINKNNPVLGNYLKNIKERILKTIKDFYNIENEIYLDILAITRWFPGMEQTPHSDNMENTEDAYIHQHRQYGIVIYLNNDFEGGQTFYPQHNFYINPQPGKLAVHPASTDHMHGVTKIEGNTRYTLTGFITFDKTKQMDQY